MNALRPTYRPASILWMIAALWATPPRCAAGPAEDQFAVAAGHYARRDWELAAAEWKTFLADFPRHRLSPAARYYLGESLTQLGRYDDVVEALAPLTKHPSNSAYRLKAKFRLGEARYMLRRFEEARPDLQAFLEKKPHDPHAPHALFYLARIDQHARRFESATATYRRLLAEHAESHLADLARLQLAQILHAQGEDVAADSFLHFVARHGQGDIARQAELQLAESAARKKRWLEVIARSRRLIGDADPTRADAARLLLARGLAERRDWPGVLTTLEPLDRENTPRSIRWSARLLQVEARVAQKELDAAEQILAETLAAASSAGQEPDTESLRRLKWRLLQAYIDVLEARNKFDEAIDCGDRLLAEESLDGEIRRVETRRQLRLLAGTERYTAMLKRVSGLPGPNSHDLDPATAYYAAFANVARGQADRALEWLDAMPQPPKTDEAAPRASQVVVCGACELRVRALIQLERVEDSVAALTAWRRYLEKQHRGSEQIAAQGQAWWKLAQATLHVAQLAARTGKRDAARKLFEGLLENEDSETRTAALSGLAWLALDAGDAARAAEWFERLLEKYPESPLAPVAAMHRGEALERLGRWDGALAMYDLAAAQYGDSLEAPRALRAAAALHAKLRQHEEAADKLQRLLERYADFPHRDSARYQLAWSLAQQEKTGRALEAYRALLRDHPQSPFAADASYRVARLLVQENRLSEAQALLEKLVSKENLDQKLAPHVWYLKMQLHLRNGSWEETGRAARKIEGLACPPAIRAQALFWKAEAAFRTHAWAEAWDGFVEADAHRDELLSALQFRIGLREAQIKAHREEWSAGLRLADELRSRAAAGDRLAEVHYVRGRCLVGLGRLDAARKALGEAIEADRPARSETAAMAAWMTGETYFMQKDYERAIRTYLRLETLYPHPRWQAAGLLQAGKCYELLGKWQRAASLYERTVRDYGMTEHVEEAGRRLRVVRQRAEASGGTRS